MLHSRVIDYHPDDWARLTYEKRRFFDWGGWLAVRPMEEMPYWRRLMRRERENGHWREVEHEHHAAIVEMREGCSASAGPSRTATSRWRAASGPTAIAAGRTAPSRCTTCGGSARRWSITASGSSGSTRPTEAIAPRRAPRGGVGCRDRRLHASQARRVRGHLGADRARTRCYEKGGRPAAIAWRDRAVEDGVLIELTVEGWRGPRWALAADPRRSRPSRPVASRAAGGRSTRRRPRRRPSSRRSIRSARASARSHCSTSTTSGRSTRRPRSASSATTRCPSCGAIDWWPGSTGVSIARRQPSRSSASGRRSPAWSGTTISSKHSHEASRGTASFSAPTSSTLRGSAHRTLRDRLKRGKRMIVEEG